MHRKTLAVLIALVGISVAMPATASHGWSTYHWPRSCSTCAASLNVYNSTVTTNTSWPTHLDRAIFGDASNPNSANRRGWNDSSALTLSVVAGSTTTTTRSSCPAVSGAVRVCNYTYGSNGWLGLAQIALVSGSTSHIAWGTAKMNDSYFNSGYPSTEKRHVMCQEVGHDFGLGHTSENGSSQNTCMDYYQNTSSSDWTSTGPNQHDFDQLLTQHHWGKSLGVSSTAVAAAIGFPAVNDLNLNDTAEWGDPIEFDGEGRAIVFERSLGFDRDGNEFSILTRVTWADPSFVEEVPDSGPEPLGTPQQ
jgi:hypothetical protein